MIQVSKLLTLFLILIPIVSYAFNIKLKSGALTIEKKDSIGYYSSIYTEKEIAQNFSFTTYIDGLRGQLEFGIGYIEAAGYYSYTYGNIKKEITFLSLEANIYSYKNISKKWEIYGGTGISLNSTDVSYLDNSGTYITVETDSEIIKDSGKTTTAGAQIYFGIKYSINKYYFLGIEYKRKWIFKSNIEDLNLYLLNIGISF